VSNGGNGVDLLGWIDDSVTLYFDRDSHWLSALRERSPWDTAPEKVWREAPVAMFIPSKDNLRMTAFMIAVRAAVQRFAPNTFQWQSAEYHGYEYVVGNVRRNLSESRNGDDREPGIYYVTTGEGLTISFSRKLIQRVIERQLQSPATQAVEGTGRNAFAFQPQLAMQTTGEGVQAVARFNYRSGLYRMNRIAWSNLPILNELRRRYPNRDPKDVFRRLFGQVIVEPTGGQYVWDEELGSYVSSLHGFHLNPQPGPPWVSVLAPADQISTAIVFQDDGLRAGFKWTSKRDSESR